MASIEEAKDIIKTTDISTVINYYHPISKKGANYEGICPFHGDTQPSLKINDNKGIYKCFACGAAGDAIKFVQDKLNVDFIESIKDIAGNLGITIEDTKKKNPKFDMALRVLQVSTKLYRKIATETAPGPFKNFLRTRNLNEESITDFQIGYAPGNNGLIKYLSSIPSADKETAIRAAKEIGIIRDNKHGKGHYDFYRDRVMFPICDHTGKVRGFSSRAVLPDQKPKYLNSGESFIFDKGNILYGFNLAKSHIRESDSVILVEGNMDVVTLHQYGFKNSVATMGVGLSHNSSRLLSNMTKNIYLAMDSDPAGLKAMTKINEEFLSHGITPKFIDFSPEKDPDEFLNKIGRLELLERIETAPTFIDHLIKNEIPNPIPENTDRKLEILNNVFHIIKPITSTLLANEKAINAAKALDLKSTNEDIMLEFKNFLEKQKKPIPFKKNNVAPQQSQKHVQIQQAPTDYEPEQFFENPYEVYDKGDEQPNVGYYEEEVQVVTLAKPEKNLLATLIMHPECVSHNLITETLDLIDHFEVKRIVQWLKEIYLEIDESEYQLFVREKMKESLPNEIKEVMASSLFGHSSLKLDEKVIVKMLNDLILKLKENTLRKERDLLKLKQKNSITDEESLDVLNEIQKVEEKLLELRNK
jgi:DNA primase